MEVPASTCQELAGKLALPEVRVKHEHHYSTLVYLDSYQLHGLT